MEENNSIVIKKNNTGLVIFLIIIILGLAGYICYDKFIKKTEEPKIEEKEKNKDNDNSQEEQFNDEEPDEDNSEAISICNNNRDLIVKTLKEKRSNDFIAKYYPNNLKNGVWSFDYYYTDSDGVVKKSDPEETEIGNPDNIDCSTATKVDYDDYDGYIEIHFSEEMWNSVLFNINTKKVLDFIDGFECFEEIDDYLSRGYASHQIFFDAEKKYDKGEEFFVGVYPLDDDYNGGDTRDFMICDYGKEDEYNRDFSKEGFCVAKYTYNYKTDSFSVEELNK